MVAYGLSTKPNMLYPGGIMSPVPSNPPPLQPIRRPLAQAMATPPASVYYPQFLSAEERHCQTSSPRGRRQREFIPEAKKDDCYWDRRRRNNEAAKRSREKRRLNDMLLEGRVVELTKENWILKAQIQGVFDNYGIRAAEILSPMAVDQILASMPSNEQILAFGNRMTRRDSFDISPNDESAPKKPKLEYPQPLSPGEWQRESGHAIQSESEEEVWDHDEETPTKLETDPWGAINLSGSSSNEASNFGEASSDQGHSNSMSPCSSSTSMSSIPHKLRFKHIYEEQSNNEESDDQ